MTLLARLWSKSNRMASWTGFRTEAGATVRFLTPASEASTDKRGGRSRRPG
jgi:hypothetical protein